MSDDLGSLGSGRGRGSRATERRAEEAATWSGGATGRESEVSGWGLGPGATEPWDAPRSQHSVHLLFAVTVCPEKIVNSSLTVSKGEAGHFRDLDL